MLTPRQLAVNQLVNASRILAQQGIADDSAGHISIRDPLSPNTAFLITTDSRTAAQVTPADIAVVRINDSVVTSAALSGYPIPNRPAEVFIHSSIYQRFPNSTVNSIAFYQTEQLLPWAMFRANRANGTSAGATASDMTSLYSATSGSAFMGAHPAPIFDALVADPNTLSLAVDNVIKGFGLAQKFGPASATVDTINQTDGFRPLVLMRNHGATVVGTSVPETVFRFIQAAKSARVQFHAAALTLGNGSTPLFVPSTVTKTTDVYLRSWLLWMTQIETAIRDDSSRSPDLWKGDGDSGSGSGSGSGTGTSSRTNSASESKNIAASSRFLAYVVPILCLLIAHMFALLI